VYLMGHLICINISSRKEERSYTWSLRVRKKLCLFRCKNPPSLTPCNQQMFEFHLMFYKECYSPHQTPVALIQPSVQFYTIALLLCKEGSYT